MRTIHLPILSVLSICFASGQTPGGLDAVLERLTRLEQENSRLRDEVGQLRAEVAALRPRAAPDPAPQEAGAAESAESPPTVAERLDLYEKRIDEQAHSKVDAGQRFPLRLTGMALANLHYNTRNAGNDQPNAVQRTPGTALGGLSIRQSILGIEYHGPETFRGGKVRGSAFLDFYSGLTDTNNFAPVRIRTASIEVDWKTRSIMIGQEKPLIGMRDPNSFAYAGISPLTGFGNLWRWQPQIRFEQRLDVGKATSVRAQGALYQTSEEASINFPASAVFARRRPGLEGRFEIAHSIDEERRIEFAPGFHVSTSHVNGVSVPSRLFSMDWFANPLPFVEFSGTFWTGQNISHFGATRQGFVIRGPGRVDAVHSRGGWAQLSFPLADRVSLNIFGGTHDDRDRDLPSGGMGYNRAGAANVQYRLAPNVIVSLEAMQLRSSYLNLGRPKANRYDLSVAYLF